MNNISAFSSSEKFFKKEMKVSLRDKAMIRTKPFRNSQGFKSVRFVSEWATEGVIRIGGLYLLLKLYLSMIENRGNIHFFPWEWANEFAEFVNGLGLIAGVAFLLVIMAGNLYPAD